MPQPVKPSPTTARAEIAGQVFPNRAAEGMRENCSHAGSSLLNVDWILVSICPGGGWTWQPTAVISLNESYMSWFTSNVVSQVRGYRFTSVHSPFCQMKANSRELCSVAPVGVTRKQACFRSVWRCSSLLEAGYELFEFGTPPGIQLPT